MYYRTKGLSREHSQYFLYLSINSNISKVLGKSKPSSMEILLLGKDINLISISFSYNFNRLLPVRPNYPSTVLEVLKAHINDVIVIEMQP